MRHICLLNYSRQNFFRRGKSGSRQLVGVRHHVRVAAIATEAVYAKQ